MKNIKELTEEYFKAFSSKNKEKLRELYAEDFSLRDWLSQAKGRERVLDLNQQFFDAYQRLDLEILSIYVDGNTTASEIALSIDDPLEGTKRLLIVDVIEFSEDGKMKDLRAYFGS